MQAREATSSHHPRLDLAGKQFKCARQPPSNGSLARSDHDVGMSLPSRGSAVSSFLPLNSGPGPKSAGGPGEDGEFDVAEDLRFRAGGGDVGASAHAAFPSLKACCATIAAMLGARPNLRSRWEDRS